MSSILRALKKAEQTETSQEKPLDSKINVQRIFSSKTRYQKKNFPLNSKQLLFTLSMVVIISGVAIFFFSSKEAPTAPPVLPSVSQTETPAQQKTHKPPTPLEKVAVPTPFKEPTKVQNPRRAQPIAEPSQPKAHEPAAPAQNLFKETPIESETILDDSLTENEKKDSTESSPKMEVLEIEDGSIKIQAISWAEIPEDRVAVINNKVVTEKDFILGYRIVQIRKDEIILDQSEQTFSLKFRYH